MENNTRQVFHTQEFDYPEWPPIMTEAINEKEESDSHLPRFFRSPRSATNRSKQSEQRNTSRSYFVALIKGRPVK
jgi:hypothetical protein